MEVKTGKIKAMANLGRQADGSYKEDLNYAIRASEPGSTFKLATLLALLEDKHVTLNDKVNLENGSWKVSKRVVYDSEPHKKPDATVKQAFEYSSNVGMAKLVWTYYAKDPMPFINHLRKLKMNVPSGIDLVGETSPVIKTPESRTWSATSLPWMSFGYEVLISPLQTLMLYNAVANEGRMMKPYLVNEIRHSGVTVREHRPEVIEESICSPETLNLLQECLEGVCAEEAGTARTLFMHSSYPVAGKTGTALVANGKHGYADHIYQSSFAGYFPANDPEYSCIVVIRNKPFAKKYYGAAIAGPVFKEVSDKLFALLVGRKNESDPYISIPDSTDYRYAGAGADLRSVMNTLGIHYSDSSGTGVYNVVTSANYQPVIKPQPVNKNQMPDVKGMGLKDVLYLLENRKVKVLTRGRGKVIAQSITPGEPLAKGQTVMIELN
jgi:cell division protein FtsI (penicillin-binding protein 3)